MKNLRKEWFGNVRGDILAGIVVCMALIPEVIGFTIVAGVDPMVGIYSSFCISVVISIFGGRTGMISAAAGSMALVLAGLVKSHGVQYMLAATILTGVIQVILGYLKVGKFMRFIPKPVMIGFVNALGIMMFKSQINHFRGSFILIILGALSIFIILGFPRITKAIPSPIISIIIVSAIVIIFKIDVKTLGDMGKITSELPKFIVPDVPLNMETLKIILPYSLSLSLVGLVESLLTAQLVDENTNTFSNKNRECIGQGMANITAGFFGGIAGCGMIGQTVVNQSYGGRGRLSTFTGGTLMLLLVILLNDYVVRIPVAALASVMLIVAFDTFDFKSIKRLKVVPRTDAVVMIVTVIIVIITDNLAYGVLSGITLSAIFFADKVSDVQVNEIRYKENIKYEVRGHLFFVSSEKFMDSFEPIDDVKEIEIDFSKAKICDESAVDAIEKVISKLSKRGIKTTLSGVSGACEQLVNNLDKV